jgi:autophagy-related protein 9
MASKFLSRLLPPVYGSPSVYETLREQDQSPDPSDVEERAGLALDEENLGTRFQHYELDDALVDATVNQRNPLRNLPNLKEISQTVPKRFPPNQRWAQLSPKIAEADDLDDEVPQSLLIEDGDDAAPSTDGNRHATVSPPIPGPTTKGSRAMWQATQEQQRLHPENNPKSVLGGDAVRRGHILGVIDPRERAMWRWANVENLDNFLKDVYDYFIGNGVWCILLSRVFYLL